METWLWHLVTRMETWVWYLATPLEGQVDAEGVDSKGGPERETGRKAYWL